MRRLYILTLTLGLGACAGGVKSAVSSVGTVRPAPDAFACIREQIKKVGFTQESYDEVELRVTARKYNEQVRRPDVQFRRLVDRMLFDVGPGRGDTVTTIAVEARTFADLMTHRGPTEQQEEPSETVKEAARTILDRCTAQP